MTDKTERLENLIMSTLEDYGLPKFKDNFPAKDVIQLCKDFGFIHKKESNMEKPKEIKIEKLILNIEGEKISLTIDQAKKLKSTLEELFGKDIIREVVKERYYDWYYRPYYYGTAFCSPGTNTLTGGACSSELLNLVSDATVSCDNSNLTVTI